MGGWGFTTFCLDFQLIAPALAIYILHSGPAAGGEASSQLGLGNPTAEEEEDWGTHGRRLFSRGGEECFKNCNTPQNGSRGGDTFSPSRGGVEGGKGGGQKNSAGENWDFCQSKKKKTQGFLTK